MGTSAVMREKKMTLYCKTLLTATPTRNVEERLTHIHRSKRPPAQTTGGFAQECLINLCIFC